MGGNVVGRPWELMHAQPAAQGNRLLAQQAFPSIAVIVPATDAPETLPECLHAIKAALHPEDELIVVTEPRSFGPAAARNAGARRATANVLLFVDADVVIHPDAVARIRAAFGLDPGLTAVFGSYDDGPASRALVAQFRNLLHHHVHHRHPGVAATFWSGLGAIRREEFLEMGGFDTERYPVSSVEDVELGMRLRAHGMRIELHPLTQGTHLKRWTLPSMVRTDLQRRGLPWMLICLERRSLPRTLNLSWREQASVTATVGLVAGLWSRRRRLTSGSLLAVGLLDAQFYWLLYRRMGILRGVLAVGLHLLHRLVAAASLPLALGAYARQSRQRLSD